MIEIRTGNDRVGWVVWQVEIPEGARWEILRRDLVSLHSDEAGIELTTDVTGLIELLEASGTIRALRDGEELAIRGLPYVHLRDVAAGIAWWLHTGMDPEELRRAAAADGPFGAAGSASSAPPMPGMPPAAPSPA